MRVPSIDEIQKQHAIVSYIQKARAEIGPGAVAVFDSALKETQVALNVLPDAIWPKSDHTDVLDSEFWAGSEQAANNRDRSAQRDISHWVGVIRHKFQEHDILVLGLVFSAAYAFLEHVYFVVAPTQKIAKQFVDFIESKRLERISPMLPDYIFDEEMRGVKRPDASWDDLVLLDGQKEKLCSAIATFFNPKTKEAYAASNLSYRRGFVLIGAPGGGKTSAIRVLASQMRQVAFFMLGPNADVNEDYMPRIRNLMWGAERLGPAIVVLEDIDRIVASGEKNLRGFLNLLDGIESPKGIFVIATSNNPQDIDKALLERPSRFDLILRFDLPEPKQRLDYLKKKFADMDTDFLEEIAKQTDKFSMAMLQEIFTGALLASISDGSKIEKSHVLQSLENLKQSRNTIKKETGSSADQKVGFF